jgi:hypothetical protein
MFNYREKSCRQDSFFFRRDLSAYVETSAVKAKVAPYPPCHRDSFSAKVPGLVAGWLRQVTLTAHTRWPLWFTRSFVYVR